MKTKMKTVAMVLLLGAYGFTSCGDTEDDAHNHTHGDETHEHGEDGHDHDHGDEHHEQEEFDVEEDHHEHGDGNHDHEH